MSFVKLQKGDCYIYLFLILEHEACIMDLNELQWHVAYSSRNEKRIKNRTNIAEVLNARLKDDIAFVKKHM